MQLYKKDTDCWLVSGDEVFTHRTDWDQLINRQNLNGYLQTQVKTWNRVDHLPEIAFDPPLQSQEVWAAGVTYMSSREARMEEAKVGGGGDFYDRVYHAQRPELFFKSMPHRVAGTGSPVRIRRDSDWNVPEPELTLFIASSGTIEGYTIGNDMSSRSIEGENPLYLPQAKTYQGSAALGPCLYVPPQALDAATEITLNIGRGGEICFSGSVPISRMKRSHPELAEWLFREMEFPHGVFLMTGTGLIPPDSFSLQHGDCIAIGVAPIGTLINTVK